MTIECIQRSRASSIRESIGTITPNGGSAVGRRSQAHSLFHGSATAPLGIAYRILGSRAEAEDAVQDTFLRWQATEIESIESLCSWLTTVCTRRAIDMLRASYRSRVDYVGSWLPESVQTVIENDTE
jgi:DNA-directed RNA polymerase specialized sigma24 family protein